MELSVIADWLAAIGFGVDFTTDTPLPEELRWPLAEAYARKSGDDVRDHFEYLTEECGW